jgi:hypothetical protein
VFLWDRAQLRSHFVCLHSTTRTSPLYRNPQVQSYALRRVVVSSCYWSENDILTTNTKPHFCFLRNVRKFDAIDKTKCQFQNTMKLAMKARQCASHGRNKRVPATKFKKELLTPGMASWLLPSTLSWTLITKKRNYCNFSSRESDRIVLSQMLFLYSASQVDSKIDSCCHHLLVPNCWYFFRRLVVIVSADCCCLVVVVSWKAYNGWFHLELL